MWKATTSVYIALAGFACNCAGSPLALVGGTIIDVSHYGKSNRDIDHSVVVLDGDRIVAVGRQDDVAIPASAVRIDVRGQFLVPGLIDGFGAIKTQGFANAWLYNGITTVSVNVADSRRGTHIFCGSPTPRIFVCELVNGYSEDGYEADGDTSDVNAAELRLTARRLTNEQLTHRLEKVASADKQTVLIHYATWPDQVDWIVHEAKRLGLSTYGELGWTNYAYAARSGVQAFIHSERYLAALAPDDLFEEYADDPFGPSANGALDYVAQIPAEGASVEHLGQMFSKYQSVLMPNIVLHHSAVGVSTTNTWRAASAVLMKPEEIHHPLDPATGRPRLMEGESAPDQEQRLSARRELFRTYDEKNRRLAESGVHFLAASGASAFGVLPGSGEVDEIVAMQNVLGLSPREALATATSNYADSLGWKGLGHIEVGGYADIVGLGADPRNDVAAIGDIRTLVAGGKKINRNNLLRLKHTSANSPPSALQTDQD